MERLFAKITKEIESGNFQISESGALVTDYGWIFEDMNHDIILRTKRGYIRRKILKSSSLGKLFICKMKGESK